MTARAMDSPPLSARPSAQAAILLRAPHAAVAGSVGINEAVEHGSLDIKHAKRCIHNRERLGEG